MTHLSWRRPFLSVTSYGYVGIYRVINTFIEKEGEEQSSICFPNKNPGTGDVEIGACFSAASGEGARVWDLLLRKLWGKGEGKCGFGNQHYSSLHLNCVFYVHSPDLIWSSQTTQEKRMSVSILETRLQRLNVFVKPRGEQRLELWSDDGWVQDPCLSHTASHRERRKVQLH